MNLIIAGSRGLHITTIDIMMAVRSAGWPLFRDDDPADPITKVICGCCKDSPDTAGWAWARANGIEVEYFPAWDRQALWARSHATPGEVIHPLPGAHGKGAGMARNALMAGYGTHLLAYWNGVSPGTASMVKVAKFRGLKVRVENR